MKSTFFIVLFCCSLTTSIISQNLNESWQIGVGFGITKFNESDAGYIGDQYIFQTPRLNLTMPIGERLSVDGAISFNTINDVGIMTNSVKYFSMDASIRYNFDAILNNFSPYLFVGGSIVDSERKMTPTFNIGAGGIYWVSDRIGINPQVYYKHSLESYESMRSHIQGALSIIIKLDWNNLFEGGNHAARSSGSCN
ncbi:hypothetical protein [uncultured Tenacibaculum sp.]|uniref:hypothetical protein n=1 Tax=uncultured Tenacibaculum sp. TaxID=174713 RepID=UPI00261592F9|nr:hypothetical protein [uncultured Tenacibaculum sp.]